MPNQRRYEDHSPDINPFNEGGCFFDNKYGDVIWFEESDEKGKYKVSVITDVKKEFTPEYLKEHSWINWDSMSTSCDCKEETDPFRLLQSCIWYYGAFEFDQYPRIMTKSEIKKMLNLY
jgi:hypothetical protein